MSRFSDLTQQAIRQFQTGKYTPDNWVSGKLSKQAFLNALTFDLSEIAHTDPQSVYNYLSECVSSMRDFTDLVGE